MANIQFEFASPERVIFSGPVRLVVLPGAEGEMTVLPGIQPTVTLLGSGFIVATDSEGQGHRSFISGGFAEMTGERLTVLADRALPFHELSRDHLDEEIMRLETIRDGTPDEQIRSQAEFAIGRLHEVRNTLSHSGAS